LKLVVMTKNEWPLIKSWVLYHAHIFGAENIYVLDSSDQPEPLAFLDLASSRLGVHVFHSQATLHYLPDEINFLYTSLNRSCDFITKADTDEFLMLYRGGQLVVDGITEYLDSLPMDGSRYKLGYMANFFPPPNCATRDDATLYTMTGGISAITFKKFFATWSYLDTDLGAHGGTVREPFNNTRIIETDLAFAHYHFQCFASRTENTRRALVSLHYIDESDTLAQQLAKILVLSKRPCDYVCCHKVPEYLDYLNDPDGARKTYEARFHGIKDGVPSTAMALLMPKLWKKFEILL
jgi:hypothetical protein